MSMPTSVLLALVSYIGVASDIPYPESNRFTMVCWNVDSGGADAQLVALRIARFQGVSLWGLCEVRDERWAQLFTQAAGENEPGNFAGILGPTGGSDRSCIIYDTTQFELVASFEINWQDRLWYCAKMPARPPLVARLRHRASGQEFFFMVNRLYGCQTDRQAAALNAWAAGRTIPVVAAGTYDFQYDPDTGPLCPAGQQTLMALIADGVFHWLAPDNPVGTLDWNRDIIDDFVFLANTRGRLQGQSHIVVDPGDFPSDEMTSDHRPVQATLMVNPAVGGETGIGRSISQPLVSTAR